MASFRRALLAVLALLCAVPLVSARSMGGRSIRHYGLGGDPFGRSDIAGLWIDPALLHGLRADSGRIYAALLSNAHSHIEL